jgi:flagellar hook-basal body complex protein FliE
MSKRQAYEKKVQAQLDEWAADVEKLRARAANADADTQIAYHRQIDELRDMQKQANDSLAALKKSGDEAWDDIKSGVESARASLNDAIDTARSRFG